MQRRRAMHAAGLGVVAALALTGCGDRPDAAGDAWSQARAQLDDAETVRVSTATVDDADGMKVAHVEAAAAVGTNNRAPSSTWPTTSTTPRCRRPPP